MFLITLEYINTPNLRCFLLANARNSEKKWFDGFAKSALCGQIWKGSQKGLKVIVLPLHMQVALH